MRKNLVALIVAVILAVALPARAATSVVVLPTTYSQAKEPLVAEIGEMALALKTGDQFLIYAAQGPRLIARVAVPDDPRSEVAAWRKRQLGEALAPALRYIADLPAAPPAGEVADNLNIPDVLEELGRNLLPGLSDKRANILLVGAWIYNDPRDARYSMQERYYPSDAHLALAATASPFGLSGSERRLAGATVHFVWPEGQGAFVSEQHEQVVRRFWTLWIAGQGGQVGTLSFDLATGFSRMRSGEASGQATYRIDPERKVEMLRVPPPQPVALPGTLVAPGAWFLRDDVPITRTPPASLNGIAWIGLKWEADVDIDLYVRPDRSSPWLFFGQTRTVDGRFNKDFLSSTGDRQFEYVEFTRAVDLSTVEIAVNLYSGKAAVPPQGVIRLWLAGAVYEAPFSLDATAGNEGRMPMAPPYWTRIDLAKVIGLGPS